jgi:hypothetical protein
VADQSTKAVFTNNRTSVVLTADILLLDENTTHQQKRGKQTANVATARQVGHPAPQAMGSRLEHEPKKQACSPCSPYRSLRTVMFMCCEVCMMGIITALALAYSYSLVLACVTQTGIGLRIFSIDIN